MERLADEQPRVFCDPNAPIYEDGIGYANFGLLETVQVSAATPADPTEAAEIRQPENSDYKTFFPVSTEIDNPESVSLFGSPPTPYTPEQQKVYRRVNWAGLSRFKFLRKLKQPDRLAEGNGGQNP